MLLWKTTFERSVATMPHSWSNAGAINIFSSLLWKANMRESQDKFERSPSKPTVMHVRLNSSQLLLVIVIAALNIYAIIRGLASGSFWGITLACASITALIFCVQIIGKLQELKDAEDKEL